MTGQDSLKTYGWAKPGTEAGCDEAPAGVINLNIKGRQPTSPIQGFGSLRKKTYRIALPGISSTPAAVMSTWKDRFSDFWPKGNYFAAPTAGFIPGETCLINLTLGGVLKLATGAMIMYVDESSLSLMTIQGHMFSGWITFSCYEEKGVIYAQNQALIRPNDPFYELSFLLGFGSKAEDVFWHQTLKNLAKHFGVVGKVEQSDEVIDKRLQWQYLSNLWHNAGIRSGMYQFTAPFRWLAKPFRKQEK